MKRRENEEKNDLQSEAENVTFTINGTPIERTHNFKCLGRWFSDNDDDAECIQENIKKARSRWKSVASTLKREREDAECVGHFYQVIV